ncbi:hypothetical protein [Elioraea sp.]|uniref:hypothetical protein n=1 Tax=Elioraea sp. TaxID=2185103 RepID=UPI0025BF5F8F|nr:hypothetical protein [Elioraea sp.]
MSGRLAGKRVVVTDAEEFMGPDIVALFRDEGAEITCSTPMRPSLMPATRAWCGRCTDWMFDQIFAYASGWVT